MCWLSPPCLCGLEVPFGLILPLLVCWGHGSQDQPYIKMIWRIIKSICPRAHILGPQNRYFFNGLHMILMKMVPARLGMTVLGSTHPNPEIRPLLQTHWGVVLMQHVPDQPMVLWFKAHISNLLLPQEVDVRTHRRILFYNKLPALVLFLLPLLCSQVWTKMVASRTVLQCFEFLRGICWLVGWVRVLESEESGFESYSVR